MDFYTRILNEKQKLLLPKLGSILSEAGFYLAGGTALALQLGHRTSLDFDFYSPNPFDRKTLSGKLNRAFGKGMVTCESHSEETLFAEIGGVKFSAFFYPYA